MQVRTPTGPAVARDPADPAIQTPDQRLRVFVSSSMVELAAERQAVTRAVSALRLTPVIFEAGARPHPPRDLYRAYLAQSDVFIGIYGQRYGWVGPGMEISGLEDELEFARGLPQLLYVKGPAPDRDPRLSELVSRVQAEGAVSYRQFRTPRELGRLVREDLATLLSERFGARPAAGQEPRSAGRRPLPVAATTLVGRERDIAAVTALLAGGRRLVTLIGQGGVGKTRLALAVAERLAHRFDRTAFVPLDEERDPGKVVTHIGRAVAAEVAGTSSSLDAVTERIGGDRWLLVLDNLEQLAAAAPDIGALLARCPGLVVLATSRTALQLRAEHEYPVSPLALPADPAGVPVEALAAIPAVGLFVDRARAVHPDFTLTAENAAAVVDICSRLGGLPLAIELAAARTRLLPPAMLLRRLSRSLDALGTGPVDLPERQQTLRVTVDWSVDLLEEAERSLLETMTVFVGGWTTEAAAQVAELDEDRALELTDALARHSLINHESTELGLHFSMLDTVRTFVAERLASRPDADAIRRRHADFYRALAQRAERPLRGISPSEWAERLQAEAGNLTAGAEWYLGHDRACLPHLFRALWPFRILSPLWGLGDHLGEPRGWIEQLLPTADGLDPQARAELLWTAAMNAIEAGDDPAALTARERLTAELDQIADPYLRGVSVLAMAWISGIAGEFDRAVEEASTGWRALRGPDEPLWTALAALTLGTLETATARPRDAERHLTAARDLADSFDNALLAVASRASLGGLLVVHGRLDEARAALERGLDLSAEASSIHSICLCLSGLAHLLLVEGDAERAALVVGAAQGLRARTGVDAWPSVRRGEAVVTDRIRQVLGVARFDRAFTSGMQLSRHEAVVVARDRGRRTITQESMGQVEGSSQR